MHYRALPMESKAFCGIPEIQGKHERICKICAQGNNAKNSFPSSESKSKGILEIIHSDVCGPMSSSSLRGYVFYFSFIYDFSRNTWIYLLKWKNEFLVSSRNTNTWSITTLKGILRLYSQIMVDISPRKNSRTSAESL